MFEKIKNYFKIKKTETQDPTIRIKRIQYNPITENYRVEVENYYHGTLTWWEGFKSFDQAKNAVEILEKQRKEREDINNAWKDVE